MKSLLGCLMCLVLTISQSFAISGGPFGGPSHVDVVGLYAGVFVPVIVVVNPGPPAVTLPADNSLALFTLSVPKTGLATGTAVIFRKGFFYPGTIQGSADPDSAKLTGVITGMFTSTPTSGIVTTTVDYFATGKFENAKILANPMFSVSAARVRGKAAITYTTVPNGADPNGNSGSPVLYKVRGFKQSSASS